MWLKTVGEIVLWSTLIAELPWAESVGRSPLGQGSVGTVLGDLSAQGVILLDSVLAMS